MNDSLYLFLAICVMSFVTYFIRAIPFIFFSNEKKIPDILFFIEQFMPSIIISVLIIYCLKNINPLIYTSWISELISICISMFLYLKFKNVLITIFIGTSTYMVLVQYVFI
jgi:branched-subunit amino acid transport protein AzlD